MQTLKSIQPAPLYYLHNYRTLLAWVRSRYDDLLDDEEKSYVDQFHQLSESAQALLTRLITRKGDYFRVSKLSYDEIPELSHALEELENLGWLNVNPVVSIGDIFNRLTRPELTSWLGKYSGTKVQWQAELEQRQTDSHRWDQWFSGDLVAVPQVKTLVGDLVALTIMPLSDVYTLLFFGNHYQLLSEFVLAELGIFQYEQVTFSDACRSFSRREDLEAYRQLQYAREQFEKDGDLARALASLPSASALPLWLAQRVDRLSFQLGYKLEQRNNYEQALDIYNPCGFIDARARRVRVLEKLGRKQEALVLLTSALAAPYSEAERQQLMRSQPRLQRALGIKPIKSVGFSPVSTSLILSAGESRVEQAVADYFHSATEPVFWTENSVWLGLFGLLFWPAIYAPVQGAFFNPFQARPKDLYHQSFVASRKSILQGCWQLLASSNYKVVMRQRYREKHGLQSPFLSWSRFNVELLDLALECISSECLSAIFTRILFDIKANSSGFPDLIQFMPAQKRFRLIEVKGPGDKLQDNQLRWLEFFEQQAIAAEVCYVQWEQR